MVVKLSRAARSTLMAVKAHGGEMNGFAGQPGFYCQSTPKLIRQGLLENLGTKRDADERMLRDAEGRLTWYLRVRMTDAGYAALED